MVHWKSSLKISDNSSTSTTLYPDSRLLLANSTASVCCIDFVFNHSTTDELCVNQNVHENISAVLKNSRIFEQFHRNTTEMVVTKQGRRMFPAPEIILSGLDPNRSYIIFMDIVPVDNAKYKWTNKNWIMHDKNDNCWSSEIFVHPDSPLLGLQWMKKSISFKTLKLTNNSSNSKGNIHLSSMHKYQPRIHLIQTCDMHLINFQPFCTFVFKECQFIAVTAYQNPKITDLKIKYNPFAKGFRDELNKKVPFKLVRSKKPSAKKRKIDDKLNTKQTLVKKELLPIIEQLTTLSSSEGLELSAEMLIDELTLPGSTSRKNLELLCQPYSNSIPFNHTIAESSFT
nr:T-box transcription factor mls-1-like [Hydra vulgaris]